MPAKVSDMLSAGRLPLARLEVVSMAITFKEMFALRIHPMTAG